MRSRKLLGSVKQFMQALTERYHRILEVIDEALASDSLKDRIWAAELLLKRAKPEEAATEESPPSKRGKKPDKPLESLSDSELLQKIQEVLRHDPP